MIMNNMGWMFVVVPGLIWGASFLFIAEGLQAVAPMGVTFVRIAIGFATLSLVPSARRPILREDRWKTVLLGILWLAFPLSMFPFAEQHVSSALTGMLNGATPLFAAVVVGIAVGFLGTILIALPGAFGADSSSSQWTGISLILVALMSYGVAINIAGP